MGYGFRVPGSGFRVQSSEFRVQSCEFRVASCSFRVAGCALRLFAQYAGFGLSPFTLLHSYTFHYLAIFNKTDSLIDIFPSMLTANREKLN
jgi:hypothetical protein